MLRKPAHVLIFLGLFGIASARRASGFCFSGCELTLGSVDFNDTSSALPKKQRDCRSVRHVTSVYLSVRKHCEEKGRDEWLKGLREGCERFNISMPEWSIVNQFSEDDVQGLRKLTAEEGLWNARTVLNEIVVPDEDFFERAYRTLDSAYYEIDIHWLYAFCMYYFWIMVVAIGISTRLFSLIQNLGRQEWQALPSSEDDLEGNTSKRHSILDLPHTLLKRYIIVPATFGYRCSQNVGWCTVPPRVQSLTIFAFVALNALLCSISYRAFIGNVWWPEYPDQMLRYVSDRTGAISLANFPLIWLFGTRNNLLMWLTGWGFGAYNNFHRWVARVATVEAVAHSIGYTLMIWQRGSWEAFMKYWTKHYFWNGELATIFMVAICVFSVYGLRRSHYEIFLITHIILSIIVLWTMFYHVEIFHGVWDPFIWPCVAFWALDRVIRTLRILAFNPRFWNTKCTATYDSKSNLVRLEVPCSQSQMLSKPKPGTYYYIYVLNNLLYLHQNHPFTLAYVSHASTEEHFIPINPDGFRVRRPSVRRTNTDSSTESDSLLPASRQQGSTSSFLVFLIRPYDGFTSRLRKNALAGPTSLRVLVEGPYGETNPIHTFANILFVVGGTGIAVPLSYLSKLLDSQSKTARIHVLWAVREHGFLADVLERDLRRILEDKDAEDRVVLTVHVTQEDTEEGRDDKLSEELGMKNYVVKEGRPNVSAAVEWEANMDYSEEGGLAVVACGPAQMADDARRACVRALERGHRGVEYFEESFKW